MVACFFYQEYIGLLIPLGVFPYSNEIILKERFSQKWKFIYIHPHGRRKLGKVVDYFCSLTTMWRCGILLHNCLWSPNTQAIS